MPGQFDAIEDRLHSLVRSLAGQAGELAAAWPRRLSTVDGRPRAIAPAEARAFVDAVGAGLDDDLAPLTALCGLDRSEGDAAAMVDRLDESLRRLDALRGAAHSIVHTLPGELDDALAVLARQLAVQAAATLAFRSTAAEERAHSGYESLAVTIHELRRPLTVLSSYAQLLSAGTLGTLETAVESAASSMLAASEVMLRLVESLAELGRLEDPSEIAQLVDLPLRTALEAAVEEVSTEAGLRQVRIDIDADAALHMRADRDRLVLALTNLLSNAVKHSPAGETVTAGAHLDGDTVVLRVRDRGPGFSEAAAERLFEKYYRDPDERARGVPGTGLGLYIVQAVVERHGGRAQARPAPGGGAEFELRLPLR